MTTESNPDIPVEEGTDPGTIAEVNGSMDTQNRLLARKLHKLGYIYALYGALDGLSLSYSMVKYGFDALCTTSDELSSDVMHEWMMTPAGIAAITAESFTLIGFSIIANVCGDNDKNAFKRFIAVSWPYCRDTMKGLKNAYKGVRSAMQVAGVFTDLDLRHMIVPVALVLGILSALNRIWLRKLKEDRKVFMRANARLLLQIQAMESMDENACEALLAKAKKQFNDQQSGLQTASLFAAGYGGIVDGLYLFMGAMGVAALTPTVYLAMTIFSTIFCLICIATRVYEEYDFQRKLIGTQAKIELAICGKELESLFNHLQEISTRVLTSPELAYEKEQEEVFAALKEKMIEFEAHRNLLRANMTLSYSAAAFAGLRDGLAAYSAVASLMFAIVTIQAMLLAPFPPAFLIATVLMGATCLIGFMTHSLIKNYLHHHKQEVSINESNKKLHALLTKLKENQQEVNDLKPTEVRENILGSMVVDPAPQFFFQEWSEVARSFFSGVAKGQKSVDYTLNPLQEPDAHGHYHDTPIMLGVTILSSSVYAVGLALRAHARGFGRDPIDMVTPPATSTIEMTATSNNPSSLLVTTNGNTDDLSDEFEEFEETLTERGCLYTGALGESGIRFNPVTDSPRDVSRRDLTVFPAKSQIASPSQIGMFSSSPRDKARSLSAISLLKLEESTVNESHTAQGLM